MATWLGAGEAKGQQFLALGRMVPIYVVVVLVLAVAV
jgi:hypothetical protein